MNKMQLIESIRSEADHLKGRQEQAVLKEMQANLTGKAQAFVTEVLKNDYDHDEKNNYEASYLWHAFECANCYGFELHYATLKVILNALIEAKAKLETLAGAEASEFAPQCDSKPLETKKAGKGKAFALSALVVALVAPQGALADETEKHDRAFVNLNVSSVESVDTLIGIEGGKTYLSESGFAYGYSARFSMLDDYYYNSKSFAVAGEFGYSGYSQNMGYSFLYGTLGAQYYNESYHNFDFADTGLMYGLGVRTYWGEDSGFTTNLSWTNQNFDAGYFGNFTISQFNFGIGYSW